MKEYSETVKNKNKFTIKLKRGLHKMDNSESEVVSNLKLEIEELKHRLKLANTIIDELIEVAEVHLDDTFEKIERWRAF